MRINRRKPWERVEDKKSRAGRSKTSKCRRVFVAEEEPENRISRLPLLARDYSGIVLPRLVTHLHLRDRPRTSQARKTRSPCHGDCIAKQQAVKLALRLYARLFHLTRFYGPIKHAYRAQYITHASQTSLNARVRRPF